VAVRGSHLVHSGFIAVVLWWTMLKRSPKKRVRRDREIRLCMADGKAWIVTIFFGAAERNFPTSSRWLAPMYVELGWYARQSRRQRSAIWIAAQVVSSPWWLVPRAVRMIAGHGSLPAARSRDRKWPVLLTRRCPLLAWVLLLGFASGGLVSLCMTLPLDYSRRPNEPAVGPALMIVRRLFDFRDQPSIAGGPAMPAAVMRRFCLMAVLSLIILVLAIFFGAFRVS